MLELPSQGNPSMYLDNTSFQLSSQSTATSTSQPHEFFKPEVVGLVSGGMLWSCASRVGGADTTGRSMCVTNVHRPLPGYIRVSGQRYSYAVQPVLAEDRWGGFYHAGAGHYSITVPAQDDIGRGSTLRGG